MEKIKLLPLKEQEYMRRLFAGCTEEIRNHMFVMEAEEGKNFIKAGDKCRNIFIILKGRAKGIDMQVQEKIYIFKEFGPGRILGEFECLSGIPEYSITIRAVTPLLGDPFGHVSAVDEKGWKRNVSADTEAFV